MPITRDQIHTDSIYAATRKLRAAQDLLLDANSLLEGVFIEQVPECEAVDALERAVDHAHDAWSAARKARRAMETLERLVEAIR